MVYIKDQNNSTPIYEGLFWSFSPFFDNQELYVNSLYFLHWVDSLTPLMYLLLFNQKYSCQHKTGKSCILEYQMLLYRIWCIAIRKVGHTKRKIRKIIKENYFRICWVIRMLKVYRCTKGYAQATCIGGGVYI